MRTITIVETDNGMYTATLDVAGVETMIGFTNAEKLCLKMIMYLIDRDDVGIAVARGAAQMSGLEEACEGTPILYFDTVS